MPYDNAESGYVTLDQQHIPYVVERSARRRRTFALFFDPAGKIRIVVPLRAKLAVIENILEERKGWIAKKLSDLKHYPRPVAPQQFVDGEDISYLGESYTLRVIADDEQKRGCLLSDGYLNVNLPKMSADAEQRRHDVRLEVLLWYKRQAKEKLPERLNVWSTTLKIPYRRCIINSPKTQWGSCSADNDIRLNWRVIMAPVELIDYLVVHELAHVIHKNHSPRFWDYVGDALPDYKARRKHLRSMSAGLAI